MNSLPNEWRSLAKGVYNGKNLYGSEFKRRSVYYFFGILLKDYPTHSGESGYYTKAGYDSLAYYHDVVVWCLNPNAGPGEDRKWVLGLFRSSIDYMEGGDKTMGTYVPIVDLFGNPRTGMVKGKKKPLHIQILPGMEGLSDTQVSEILYGGNLGPVRFLENAKHFSSMRVNEFGGLKPIYSPGTPIMVYQPDHPDADDAGFFGSGCVQSRVC